MKRLTYEWLSRSHNKDGITDSYRVYGSGGDTTEPHRIDLEVVEGETDEDVRARLREMYNRPDVHWW